MGTHIAKHIIISIHPVLYLDVGSSQGGAQIASKPMLSAFGKGAHCCLALPFVFGTCGIMSRLRRHEVLRGAPRATSATCGWLPPSEVSAVVVCVSLRFGCAPELAVRRHVREYTGVPPIGERLHRGVSDMHGRGDPLRAEP